MATYYVNDGGTNTSPYDDWTKAATSFFDLAAGFSPFAAGDIIYVASNHVDQKTSYAADLVVSGPTGTALPATIISVTENTTNYAVATADQVAMDSGTHEFQFKGNLAVYGVQISTDERIKLATSNSTYMWLENCRFKPGHAYSMTLGDQNGTNFRIVNCTFDYTNDTGSTTGDCLIVRGTIDLIAPVFANVSNRTGTVFEATNNATVTEIWGADLSAFGSSIEIIGAQTITGHFRLFNTKLPATYNWFGASIYRGGRWVATNTGTGDQPTFHYNRDQLGELESSTSVYRDNSATIEGTNYSWGGPTTGIETTAYVSLDAPFYTDWVYGSIASTGSKTFDVYIAHNNTGTADFNDDEIWLEVEYKGASSSALWSHSDDRPTNRTTAGSAQADDSSAWTGDTFTYKQKLSVTETVNTTGLFRWRVAIAVASLASADDLYIDPTVTVTVT